MKIKNKLSRITAIENDVLTLSLTPYTMPIIIIVLGILTSLIIFFTLSYTGATKTEPLPLPKVTTTINDEPYLGDITKAKYAIIEFSDMECPICQSFHAENYENIITKFVDTNESILVYRDFPLSFHDPVASKASYAAECVNELEGNNAYFNFIQNYYYSTKSNGEGLPSDITLEDLAIKVGVSNIAEFNKCVEEDRFKEEVATDIEDGISAGVNGTPNFIIGILEEDGTVNGILYPGSISAENLQDVIDEYLK